MANYHYMMSAEDIKSVEKCGILAASGVFEGRRKSVRVASGMGNLK